MVLREVFIKERAVDFAWMVMESIDQAHATLAKKGCEMAKRLKREELPYTCRMMRIFEHFKVSFKGYTKEKVKSS